MKVHTNEERGEPKIICNKPMMVMNGLLVWMKEVIKAEVQARFVSLPIAVSVMMTLRHRSPSYDDIVLRVRVRMERD